MDNHYHLLVHTPNAILTQAIQWLHVSHGARFNWADRGHKRSVDLASGWVQNADLKRLVRTLRIRMEEGSENG